ncbi:hypothetical protein Tco_0111632 [Tanacetum coccineum]
METEFKNRDLLNVCGLKGSRGNTSIARTPQQNGVADEKELDLIEAGTKDKIDAGDSEKEDESAQDCFELPIWHSYSSTNPFASKSAKKIGGPKRKNKSFWMILQDYKGKKRKLMRKLKLSERILNK